MNKNSDIERLQAEITALKERNKRVEADKAWETSFIRKISIGFLTYGVMVVVMVTLQVENAFVSACIPTIGYLLSTISLSKVKSWWIKKKLHI